MTGTSRTTDRGTGPWREDDVPWQAGRTAVVTGVNTGIVFEAARVLAERLTGVSYPLPPRAAG